ncbi:hypothetical protein SBA2_360044 [Acidobacteriia bacterium SbA2]|nr:hypothetical protein SBA2_360044 [Acidobacteriia bacterium SbA2]
MGTTPEKRRKEMKRLEKQREKAERRAQRKIASRRQKEILTNGTNPAGDEALIASAAEPAEPAPQN